MKVKDDEAEERQSMKQWQKRGMAMGECEGNERNGKKNGLGGWSRREEKRESESGT